MVRTGAQGDEYVLLGGSRSRNKSTKILLAVVVLVLIAVAIAAVFIIATQPGVDRDGDVFDDSLSDLNWRTLFFNASRIQFCAQMFGRQALLTCKQEISADALCVSQETGRVVLVGALGAIRSACSGGVGTRTKLFQVEEIDLRGGYVLPGFTDGHAHVLNFGEMLGQADLVGVVSPSQAVQRLGPFYAEAVKAKSWLLARGWNQELFPGGRWPSAADLDTAFPAAPVWLRRIDGHAAWANSLAMSLAGITQQTPDPPGGEIVRNSTTGEPIGIFIDNAMDLIDAVLPARTDSELAKDLMRAQERLLSLGITGVHDAGVGAQTVRVMAHALESGNLTMRIYSMVSAEADIRWGEGRRRRAETVFDIIDRWCARGITSQDKRTGSLHVRSAKMFLDGALGSRGALLFEPYSDDPNTTGLQLNNESIFGEMALKWLSCGFQVGSHAIGTKANSIVLDSYTNATMKLGWSAMQILDARLRVEHAQVVRASDRFRMKALGAIASMQPTHATSDMWMAEARLGQDRCRDAYAWKSFLNDSTPLCFGSDFPVELADPRLGMFAAVTRQQTDGSPPGGWFPSQRLRRWEAFHAFTLAAAASSFSELDQGSLSSGSFADFVVWDRDLLDSTADPSEILAARVLATYVGGIQRFSL